MCEWQRHPKPDPEIGLGLCHPDVIRKGNNSELGVRSAENGDFNMVDVEVGRPLSGLWRYSRSRGLREL